MHTVLSKMQMWLSIYECTARSCVMIISLTMDDCFALGSDLCPHEHNTQALCGSIASQHGDLSVTVRKLANTMFVVRQIASV